MNAWKMKRAPTLAVSLLTAALPVLSGCGGGNENARAQAAGPDSALQSILGAAAADAPSAPTSPRISGQQQDARPFDVATMGYNEGPPTAVVKVFEISDFGCGYCRQFQQEIYPTLKRVYVDGGYLEWKFIPYVMGMFPNSLEAATAAECAGEQDQFFPMKLSLFENQARWKSSPDPFPILAEMATDVGLDMERYNACMEGGWRDNALRTNVRFGQTIGVQGTPTFMIDGRPLPGALPVEPFRDILDIALRQRGITPPER